MKKVQKAHEITDAKIQFVSLVDQAANKRQFLLKKADDGTALFSTCGKIIKTDSENHYVTGIVYEPMTEDSQGNYMSEEEIIKAAYWFAKNGDKVDLQHSFEPLNGAAVVESWVAKADFEIDSMKIKKGTWLMTVEISDEDVWKEIENGEITGFSMGGQGNYSKEDIDLENINKNSSGEKKSLLRQIAKALGISNIEKGDTAALYEERSKGTLFWNAFNALEETLHKYNAVTGCREFEADEEKVREHLEDFNKIITSILTGKDSITDILENGNTNIEKAGKKMSDKNKETLNAIYEALGVFLKEFDDNPQDDASKGTNPAEENTTEEAIAKYISKAVEKVLKPQNETIRAEQIQKMISDAVEKAVEPIRKHTGLPSNLNSSANVEKQSGEHYLHGII